MRLLQEACQWQLLPSRENPPIERSLLHRNSKKSESAMPDPTSTSSESNTRELSSQGEVGVSSESSSQDPTPRAEEEILCSIEDGLLTVTLNRPEVGNALHGTMRDRLGDIFDEASSTLSVRAVLLNARGKAFCTGADLRGSQVSRKSVLPDAEIPDEAPDQPSGYVARMLHLGWQRLIASVLDCEKPVVCAVNGTAAGGGANLALACDLIVMGETARIIEVFVRRGIVPDAGGCYLLPRLVGLSRAKQLMFFGDDVSASEAERYGLVNSVVPSNEVEETARQWALRLASGPTRTIAMTKRLLNRSLESDREGAFADEAWAQEVNMVGTLDAKEGVRAFVERRDPKYRGW